MVRPSLRSGTRSWTPLGLPNAGRLNEPGRPLRGGPGRSQGDHGLHRGTLRHRASATPPRSASSLAEKPHRVVLSEAARVLSLPLFGGHITAGGRGCPSPCRNQVRRIRPGSDDRTLNPTAGAGCRKPRHARPSERDPLVFHLAENRRQLERRFQATGPQGHRA
jgi:hypothetical protein